MKQTRFWEIARSIKNRLVRVVSRTVFERGAVAETAERVYRDKLGITDPDHVHYAPSPWTYLPRALRHCTIRPTDVFVEFGSGKGRVIWQAARRPFARVVGVERFPELNAIARRNIEHNRERLVCRHVELITADATEFRVPDDMTFAYFYNPFKGATFERVIDNIVASLDRQPRKLMLIYAYPAAHECIPQTGRFELVRVIKGHRPDRGLKNRINIYESREPVGEPDPAGSGRPTQRSSRNMNRHRRKRAGITVVT